MRQILLRGAARLVAYGVGVLMAWYTVPGVSMRLSGLLVAIVVFSIVQTALSPFILRLPHGYAPLVMGSTALIMSFAALGLAAATTHALCIRTGASWLAAGVVAWLSATIGAILLPDVYTRNEVHPA